MGQLPPGLAKWQAEHKAQKSKSVKPSAKLPPAVYNNASGLPKVGKRHAKVMTETKC